MTPEQHSHLIDAINNVARELRLLSQVTASASREQQFAMFRILEECRNGFNGAGYEMELLYGENWRNPVPVRNEEVIRTKRANALSELQEAYELCLSVFNKVTEGRQPPNVNIPPCPTVQEMKGYRLLRPDEDVTLDDEVLERNGSTFGWNQFSGHSYAWAVYGGNEFKRAAPRDLWRVAPHSMPIFRREV